LATWAFAAAIVAAAFSSTNPHPVFPACNAAASAEQTPTVGLPAQQAEEQSAFEVQPPDELVYSFGNFEQ